MSSHTSKNWRFWQKIQVIKPLARVENSFYEIIFNRLQVKSNILLILQEREHSIFNLPHKIVQENKQNILYRFRQTRQKNSQISEMRPACWIWLISFPFIEEKIFQIISFRVQLGTEVHIKFINYISIFLHHHKLNPFLRKYISFYFSFYCIFLLKFNPWGKFHNIFL